MGDFWCPVGGRCAGSDCEVNDPGVRCETHGCPLISMKVLHAIRDEVRRPQLQAVANWKVRYGELEHSLSDAMEQIEAIQGSNAVHMERVAELEAEKLALDTCWNCKVTLEKVGSPESRVPRCTECPEPESMDDVDQRGEVPDA